MFNAAGSAAASCAPRADSQPRRVVLQVAAGSRPRFSGAAGTRIDMPVG